MSSSRVLAGIVLVALIAGSLPVAANPAVPYCNIASLGGASSSTADAAVMPELCEQVTSRVFPEAFAHPAYGPGVVPATDYVGYFEFQRGLDYLAAQHPDYVTVHEVALSAGLVNAVTGERDHHPVYIVELTNKQSPMPLDERQSLLFMLSIHGNEKGGREGGFRVLEDLAKGIGIAADGVQNGAGLPEPIPKPTGGDVATYWDYLDFMRVFLLFPNSDGWAHDELEYVNHVDDDGTLEGNPYCTGLFCRQNGHGTDLNRQAPTIGWHNPDKTVRRAVGEPESTGYYTWMVEQDIEWAYGIDIHGMLNHENFFAIMMPAASMTPQEMQRSVRLAETVKERLNGNDHFAAWETVFGTAESVTEDFGGVAAPTPVCTDVAPAVVDAVDSDGSPLEGFGGYIGTTIFGPACGEGSPVTTVGSGTFAEYYTVIDAIGYSDSGFNSDWFAQETGLDAPGYGVELAYNHIIADSQYEVGAVINDYHVESVRETVKAFMDAAALDVQISFETGGKRTLYLEPSFVATNLDDEDPTPGAGSWAVENDADDLWDYGPDDPFFARPAQYWDDLRPFLRDGDQPGVLVRTGGDRITAAQLDGFDSFVIPGSAIKQIEADAAAVATIADWVNGGGTLILTDEALRYFDLAGITSDAVDVAPRYMGGIRMDLDHELLQKVRGGVKQTYEPTPLGFAVGANAAPNWYIDEAKFTAIGGEVAGIECGTTSIRDPCFGHGVGLGQVDVGAGQIRFIGSLLPDPTEEFYHPYGLDHYATTYSGNQILRNMLGWDEVFLAPPIVITDDGQIVESSNEPAPSGTGAEDGGEGAQDTPSPWLLAPFSLLGAAFVKRRRCNKG